MTMTALIDGDIFAYQAATAHEVETQWDEFLWTLHADAEAAQYQLQSTIDEVANKLEADHVVVALSDRRNWRKGLSNDYKAHRKTRKPVIFPVMRDYCMDAWDVVVRPWLEADDVLGILSTAPSLYPGDKVIVSIDKDFKGVPGKLLNSQKARREQVNRPMAPWTNYIQTITLQDADLFHMTQALTGDATDGYKGCPGVGPKGAEKVLATAIDEDGVFYLDLAWKAVVKAYEKAKLGVEDALLNARLARICRVGDYDFKKKEVKLWNPPKLTEAG